MRVVFVFLLFHISIVVTAQSSAANQIKAIFDDAANGFKMYSGMKKMGVDSMPSTYNATITIEGTTDNDIFKDSSGYMYSALISNSVSRKIAISIAEEWKVKLKESLGSFKKWEGKSLHGIEITGYVYRRENSSVSIDVAFENRRKKSIIMLHISYYH